MKGARTRLLAARVGLVLLLIMTLVAVFMALRKQEQVPQGSVPVSPVVTTSIPSTSATVSRTQSSPMPTPSVRRIRAGSQDTVVVVGDGFSPEQGWSKELGRQLRLAVVTFSADGMGYSSVPETCPQETCTDFSGLAASAAQRRPAAVIIVGSGADGDQDIRADVVRTVAAFRKALPDARLLLMTPLSARDPWPGWLDRHQSTIKSVAQSERVGWLDASEVAKDPASYSEGRLTAGAQTELASRAARALTR